MRLDCDSCEVRAACRGSAAAHHRCRGAAAIPRRSPGFFFFALLAVNRQANAGRLAQRYSRQAASLPSRRRPIPACRHRDSAGSAPRESRERLHQLRCSPEPKELKIIGNSRLRCVARLQVEGAQRNMQRSQERRLVEESDAAGPERDKSAASKKPASHTRGERHQ